MGVGCDSGENVVEERKVRGRRYRTDRSAAEGGRIRSLPRAWRDATKLSWRSNRTPTQKGPGGLGVMTGAGPSLSRRLHPLCGGGQYVPNVSGVCVADGGGRPSLGCAFGGLPFPAEKIDPL